MCPGVHYVDSITVQTGQNHPVATLRRVVIATGADVPSSVVKLVCHIRHEQTIDNLLTNQRTVKARAYENIKIII